MSLWQQRSATQLVLGAWIGVGTVAVALSPKAEPPGPLLAQEVFGNARSVQSAADAGLLAFARTLERLGYEVGLNTKVGAPAADVLFLMEPVVVLAEGEIAELSSWVKSGGRLVYAPTSVQVHVQDDPTKAEPDADFEIELEDNLARALVGEQTPIRQGDVHLYALGKGQVVVLPSGAMLSNASLRAQGIKPALPWLHAVLDGVHHIHFDEARLLLAAQEDLFSLLEASRFSPALGWALAALLMALWAAFIRRMPAASDVVVLRRSFSEHLNAVAHLLKSTHRVTLAHKALVLGATHRLGGLVQLARARAILAKAAPRTTRELTQTARELAELEFELLGQGDVRQHAT